MSEYIIKNDISEKREAIWKVEIDLLKEIDRICKKYGLTYFVTNGTLLGTIRHHGFIPWDDDLDVMMPRQSFDKLKEIAGTEIRNPYFLHVPDENGNYYRNYLRLRNEDTTAIPLMDYDKDCCKGIFVDIFPMDECHNNLFIRKIDFGMTAIMSEMANTYVYYSYFHKYRFARWLLYVLAKIYCKKNSYKSLLDGIENRRSKYDGKNEKNISVILHGNKVSVFPRAYFEKTISKEFEGMPVPVPQEYDAILKSIYGDYMTLPPAEKRVSKHNIYFDPYVSYKDIHDDFDVLKGKLYDF